MGGKFWPPRGLSPKRRCPRPGRFSKPLREPPFRLRGAWDFGGLRPDLSLASEPAWRVRWLVRLGRPRARLGGSAPATGTSATGRATDSVGSFASVGPGGAERGSGICPPRDGDLRDGPGHGPPEPPPRTRSGTPWTNQTPDLPCSPVPRSQATDHLNSLREPGREPPGKIQLQTYLAYLVPRLASPLQLSQGPSPWPYAGLVRT